MKPKLEHLQETSLYTRPVQHTRNIALIYPNAYTAGMSNLGFLGVHRLLEDPAHFNYNHYPGEYIPRFFYNSDHPKSCESPDTNAALSSFDILIVSLSFELDSVWLFNMLKDNGIPILKTKRRKKDPLLIIGGSAVLLNPYFWLPIADIIFNSTLEDAASHLLDFIYKRFTSEIQSKTHPNKGIIIEATATHPAQMPFYNGILSNRAHFSNFFLIEITRSCRFRCVYCPVQKLYKSFSSFDKDKILDPISKLPKTIRQVGLISALTTEYPLLIELVDSINQMGKRVNFASLRLDKIDATIMELLQRNEQQTLTLAPETGNEHLRFTLGKRFSNATIIQTAALAFNYKIKKLKLYFMLGLPGEKDQNVKDIYHLVQSIYDKARENAAKTKKMPKIHLSIAPFIPKPLTPLAGAPFPDIKNIRKQIQTLKKKLSPFGITVEYENLSLAPLHYALSHGDPEMAIQLEQWIHQGMTLQQIARETKKD